MKIVTLGIDIGGTFAKFGLVDRDGDILADSKISSDKQATAEDFIKELINAVEELKSGLSYEVEIEGVGVGAPNANYYKGTIEYAPNVVWAKDYVPFANIFKEQMPNVPFAITNDANAAALGEMIYGGAKEMKNFILLTLGTGLGSGIVIDGEMVYGEDGFAGELGHVNTELGGRMCGTGKRGCLEAYCSATGIKRTVFQLMADEIKPSPLRAISFNDMTAKDIFEAAQNGDDIALQAFEFTGSVLGQNMADFVAFSRPEAIFLFGGLMNAGDLILEPVKKHFEESLLKIYQGKIKVLPSGLIGKSAAILGASALIRKELN